jgi:hypothetical protein
MQRFHVLFKIDDSRYTKFGGFKLEPCYLTLEQNNLFSFFHKDYTLNLFLGSEFRCTFQSAPRSSHISLSSGSICVSHFMEPIFLNPVTYHLQIRRNFCTLSTTFAVWRLFLFIKYSYVLEVTPGSKPIFYIWRFYLCYDIPYRNTCSDAKA